MYKFIFIVFIIWRVALELIALLAKFIVPIRPGFLGPIPWANFDGVHYLSIAERGYVQYEQAFFPFYPLLIRWLAPVFGNNYVLAGMLISNVCFIGVLILLWKIVVHTYKKRKDAEKMAKTAVVALLVFPTSYYFGSIYTESLFMLFVLAAYYSLINRNRLAYGFYAAIASATRLIGAFLLVPVGTAAYMFYLHKATGDALMFIHSQPAFGANRSGGDLVILPQVLWRYAKIYATVSPNNYDFWIAVLELLMFILVLYLLWKAWKANLSRSWIYFSLAAVIGPTLTGTLSSVPRYVLAAFPIFIVIALSSGRTKKLYYITSLALLIVLTMLFSRGHWVS